MSVDAARMSFAPPGDRATMGMKTSGLSGWGEKLGTARSVHGGAKTAPWDRVGSPQFCAGSAVFEGGDAARTSVPLAGDQATMEMKTRRTEWMGRKIGDRPLCPQRRKDGALGQSRQSPILRRFCCFRGWRRGTHECSTGRRSGNDGDENAAD